MQDPSIPNQFKPLIDELVDLSSQGDCLAHHPDMSQFEKWLQDEGYDFALECWKDELVVLDLKKLAESGFSDSELCDYQGVDKEEIDDSLRVEFARSLIEYEFEPGVETYVYTIHQLPITNSSGTSAVLGYKMQQHGQHGSEFYLQGIFTTEEDLLEHLRCSGHILHSEMDEISDALILGLWKSRI